MKFRAALAGMELDAGSIGGGTGNSAWQEAMRIKRERMGR